MSVIDIERLLAPISESQPVGEDAKYEFCYEMMESEVKKFGSLFGETVDWQVVKNHAVEVLEHHSKDIKALCYLIRALLEEEGLKGFHQGLSLLNGALNEFGSHLYPTRKRARDSAVSWLSEQFELMVQQLEQSLPSSHIIDDCVKLIGSVQGKFDELFPDSETDFFAIRGKLNALAQRAALGVNEEVGQPSSNPTATVSESAASEISESVPAPAQQVEAPQSANEKPAQASVEQKPVTPTPTAPVKRQNTTQKQVDIDTDFSSPTASTRTLKKVAEVMLNANPAEPLAYRIYRYVTWSEIDGLPAHNNGQTELGSPVSSDQLAEYTDKAQRESDINVVKRLEKDLVYAPFWVTGHFLVYSMLKNLGLDDAAAAVQQETQSFVDTLPGIQKLSFKNSMPFADEAALNWLASQRPAHSGSHSMIKTVVISEEESMPMEDITLENFGEFAAEIAQKLDLDGSGRGQFVLYLQLITAYQTAGLYPLCLPYLEKGWEICNAFNLANWEPHLSIQLEGLIRVTLHALFENKDLLPEKYEMWESIYG
ncbi:type VI secretion system ImpA domain-containing protein [Vibrio azureus]|uniref:Putative type VI secretion system protein n=1 Tax=Vibrio azureus NBRC 104587 TaxID=1219077 RepID=U3CD40_9VIBR|nr:type VI secretion system protein TssA [Vibrio azureus]AUI87867.1 type VI secretion system ImpA domain-containing protein [Vibrio azureus]GAD76258.1 putative type VI secretion system protein [Vibrio azureus NBRC 104587]